MALFLVLMFGMANFALHRAVLDSGHQLLDRTRWFQLLGGKFSLTLEFAMLLGAALLVGQGAQGWAWFVQAINLGARNPRATFGAALLLIAAVYLLMLLAGLLMALVGGAAPADPMQLGSGPLLVMVLLMLALRLE